MNPTKILSLIEDKNIYNLLRGDGPFMAELGNTADYGV